MKARGGRRDALGKVLKDRRSPRRRVVWGPVYRTHLSASAAFSFIAAFIIAGSIDAAPATSPFENPDPPSSTSGLK